MYMMALVSKQHNKFKKTPCSGNRPRASLRFEDNLSGVNIRCENTSIRVWVVGVHRQLQSDGFVLTHKCANICGCCSVYNGDTRKAAMGQTKISALSLAMPLEVVTMVYVLDQTWLHLFDFWQLRKEISCLFSHAIWTPKENVSCLKYCAKRSEVFGNAAYAENFDQYSSDPGRIEQSIGLPERLRPFLCT